MAKKKHARMDGLGPREIEDIRKAIRLVWTRGHSRALVKKRCTGKGGFLYCEQCKKRTPDIKVDHIEKVGDVDGAFITRLFTPSINLQGLCKKCHDIKTKAEKNAVLVDKDFF